MIAYQELLAAAQASPRAADFHALRMAYTRSPDYRPYTQQKGLIGALDAALRARNLDEALAAAERLLAVNYLDIEAHMAADYVYTVQEDRERATYHRRFAKGLIEAILATGTGRDPDAAFIVIDIPEEYTVMRVTGLEPGKQSLIQHDGHWLDVFEVHQRSADAGAANFKVYFNVDLPRTWLTQRLEQHNEAAAREATRKGASPDEAFTGDTPEEDT